MVYPRGGSICRSGDLYSGNRNSNERGLHHCARKEAESGKLIIVHVATSGSVEAFPRCCEHHMRAKLCGSHLLVHNLLSAIYDEIFLLAGKLTHHFFYFSLPTRSTQWDQPIMLLIFCIGRAGYEVNQNADIVSSLREVYHDGYLRVDRLWCRVIIITS